MKELLDASFETMNLLPTVFLLLCFLYWITVIIGIFDLDSFDFEVEADVDVDVDMDLDVEAEIDADIDADADVNTDTEFDKGISFLWLNSVLSFFNLGKVPFMILFSFFALSFWAISIMLNHYTGNSSSLIGIAFLIPNFIASLFVAKIMTTPFVKLFGKLDNANVKEKLVIGKVAKIILPGSQSQMGQAEINMEGNILRINVKALNENSLEVNDTVLAIEYIEKDNLYLVEPYKNS